MLCNGSPRGKAGNTAILLEHFTRGFMSARGNSYELAYLKEMKCHAAIAAGCLKAQAVIIAFPLYADSMPAVVKDFIETLVESSGSPAVRNKKGASKRTAKNGAMPPLGFIVQSGFPETAHSRYVEKYLEKLARRMNAPYLGTVIRGGVEGIQSMPRFLTRRLFTAFRSLGRHFGVTKEFHPIIVKSLAGRDRMSAPGRAVFRLLLMTGLVDMGWDMMLKKNGVYQHRFDRPYITKKD